MMATIKADLTELLAQINQERGLPANHGLERFLRGSLRALMARPDIREKLLTIRLSRDDAELRPSA